MKRSRPDWLLVILAILLILAMVVTLVMRTGRSRHGYGSTIPAGQDTPASIVS